MTHKANKSLAAICTAVVIFNFSSCKYEDGPAFSLKTKKKRLVGEWVVTSNENPNYSDYDFEFEFEKDGDFTLTITYTYSYYGYYSYTDTYKLFGDWEWEDGKETIEVDVDDFRQDFKVLRLTSDELKLEDENNYEWEFEKD